MHYQAEPWNEGKPLEEIRIQSSAQVIITFLEDEQGNIEMDQEAEKGNDFLRKNPTQLFLEKCEGWEDTRSPEEIVAEIYASRTISKRGQQLFQPGRVHSMHH